MTHEGSARQPPDARVGGAGHAGDALPANFYSTYPPPTPCAPARHLSTAAAVAGGGSGDGGGRGRLCRRAGGDGEGVDALGELL